MQSKKEFGAAGEARAAAYLAARGYAVLARNFHAAGGEVDLVCKLNETYVFVEVKARRGDRYGHAIEAVTPTKLRRVVCAAETWLAAHDCLLADWRVDVVTLDGPQIEHFENVETE